LGGHSLIFKKKKRFLPCQIILFLLFGIQKQTFSLYTKKKKKKKTLDTLKRIDNSLCISPPPFPTEIRKMRLLR